ncbi:hypothetical protein DTO063F5_7090 [Paecilomyces variotii]|nr:hypothetical protein DTO063F5_7090 [Paecilomyces variotii]
MILSRVGAVRSNREHTHAQGYCGGLREGTNVRGMMRSAAIGANTPGLVRFSAAPLLVLLMDCAAYKYRQG